MAKKAKIIKPVTIELTYSDSEDLEAIKDDKNFKGSLYEEALPVLTAAIKSKKTSIVLYKLPNLGLEVTVEKKNYKQVLEKIVTHFVEKEEYELCKEITDLISQI
jgi:hypothetical protein